MAYRDVTMVEIKEVIRLWRAGIKKKRFASQLKISAATLKSAKAKADSALTVELGFLPHFRPPKKIMFFPSGVVHRCE